MARRARLTAPGEQPEVGVDADGAADPGSSPSVVAAHEVAKLAFDLVGFQK